MITYLIVLPLVFLGGFVDAIAGGGGLITLPAYMFAGLPVHNAIATNKLSSFMGTSVTTISFARKGFIKLKQAACPVLCALLGSSCGAKTALALTDQGLKAVMLAILPIVAWHVFKKKEITGGGDIYSFRKTVILASSIAFCVGFYDGFYGPGTGTFLILLLTSVAKTNLNSAAGITKAINLATNVAALVVYSLSGKTLVTLGLIAGGANMLGNYLGAHLFIKTGGKSLRPVVLFVLSLFFIKLLSEVIL